MSAISDQSQPETTPKKLAVLISGRGSNLSAILAAQAGGELSNGKVVLVVSNKKSAAGLEISQAASIPTVVVAMKDVNGDKKPLAEFDAEIVRYCRDYAVDAIVLAGYGRIVSSVLLNAYPSRIVNIHPSLLPDFGGVGMVGMAVHQAVLKAKPTKTGCTVHLVTEAVDEGSILGQAEVPLYDDDTAEIIAARVLFKEHQLYPAVLERWIAHNYLSSHGLNWPLDMAEKSK